MAPTSTGEKLKGGAVVAEGKIKKDKAKEKTRRLKKEPEPAFEKEKAQDETAEVNAMDLTSPEWAIVA